MSHCLHCEKRRDKAEIVIGLTYRYDERPHFAVEWIEDIPGLKAHGYRPHQRFSLCGRSIRQPPKWRRKPRNPGGRAK